MTDLAGPSALGCEWVQAAARWVRKPLTHPTKRSAVAAVRGCRRDAAADTFDRMESERQQHWRFVRPWSFRISDLVAPIVGLALLAFIGWESWGQPVNPAVLHVDRSRAFVFAIMVIVFGFTVGWTYRRVDPLGSNVESLWLLLLVPAWPVISVVALLIVDEATPADSRYYTTGSVFLVPKQPASYRAIRLSASKGDTMLFDYIPNVNGAAHIYEHAEDPSRPGSPLVNELWRFRSLNGDFHWWRSGDDRTPQNRPLSDSEEDEIESFQGSWFGSTGFAETPPTSFNIEWIEKDRSLWRDRSRKSHSAIIEMLLFAVPSLLLGLALALIRRATFRTRPEYKQACQERDEEKIVSSVGKPKATPRPSFILTKASAFRRRLRSDRILRRARRTRR